MISKNNNFKLLTRNELTKDIKIILSQPDVKELFSFEHEPEDDLIEKAGVLSLLEIKSFNIYVLILKNGEKIKVLSFSEKKPKGLKESLIMFKRLVKDLRYDKFKKTKFSFNSK